MNTFLLHKLKTMTSISAIKKIETEAKKGINVEKQYQEIVGTIFAGDLINELFLSSLHELKVGGRTDYYQQRADKHPQ